MNVLQKYQINQYERIANKEGEKAQLLAYGGEEEENLQVNRYAQYLL